MYVSTIFSKKLALLTATAAMTAVVILSLESQLPPQAPGKENEVTEKLSPGSIESRNFENNVMLSRVIQFSSLAQTSPTANGSTSQQSGRIHPPHPQLSSSVSGDHDFARYQNDTHKLSILYPKDWLKVQTGNNISFISPHEGKEDSYQEKLEIDILISGNIPLSEIVSLDVIKYRQNTSNFKLVDHTREKLAGNIPAQSIVYTYGTEQESLPSHGKVDYTSW